MRAKAMASTIVSDTARIIRLIESMGAEMMFEQRENDPVEGGRIEILFRLPQPAGFRYQMRSREVGDLFYKEKGDLVNRIRFRTPKWGGKGVSNEERNIQFLDTLKKIEERLERR